MFTIKNNEYNRSIRIIDYFFALFMNFFLNLGSVVYFIPNKDKEKFTKMRDVKNFGKTVDDIPFNYYSVENVYLRSYFFQYYFQ